MKINITIPVLNEEGKLSAAIQRLSEWVADQRGLLEWEVVIADNGSTDRTAAIGRELAGRWPGVSYVRFAERGRGAALSRVWLASDANVLSYMDVDLSSDLRDFPALLEAVAQGRTDIAIGSRLISGAQTTRSLSREIVSRVYNHLLRVVFQTRIHDTQCGFKVVSAAAGQALLPQVKDRGWFWDSELLLNAERQGWRIFEHPIRWVENLDSRVAICRTAWLNVCGIYRLRMRFWRSKKLQLSRTLKTGGKNARVRVASSARDEPNQSS